MITFTRAGDMRRHMRTIHEKTESYTCHCEEVFMSKRSLHSHYMRVHLSEINIEAMNDIHASPDMSPSFEKFRNINIKIEESSNMNDVNNFDITKYPILISLLTNTRYKNDVHQ